MLKDSDTTIADIIDDATKLNHSNIQKRVLKENIIEILKKINDELNIAHKEGEFQIFTTLPTVFDIPNMSNKVSQRIIWYQIIKILSSKNYRVYINPTKDVCKLKITWITKEDEVTILHHTKTIAEHTKIF